MGYVVVYAKRPYNHGCFNVNVDVKLIVIAYEVLHEYETLDMLSALV